MAPQRTTGRLRFRFPSRHVLPGGIFNQVEHVTEQKNTRACLSDRAIGGYT